MPRRPRRVRVPKGLLVDMAPLQHSRDFRLLFSGQLVSTLGTQLTAVAVPYQVFRITHSSLDVGLVSLAQLVPLLVFSMVGGVVADVHDRRRILMATEMLMAFSSAGLAVNGTLHRPALWPLFVFTAAQGGLAGFDRPTFNAAIPRLVPTSDLAAAYALWQVQFQIGIVVGPSLAGLILAGGGAATVYWLDVGTFLVSFASVALQRSQPPLEETGGRSAWRSVGEGFSYLRGRQNIQGVYLLDIDAMVFGMPRALFPALGLDFFHGGAEAVGFLYAAPGAGALIGALTTGWVNSVRRQGRAVIIAVVLWGAAIAVFGLIDVLWVGLVLLALAGWADVVSAVFRNTILQTAIPDNLRGRLSAIQIAVVQGGPRLGDLEAGAVAEGFGNVFSVVSGGVACVVGAVALAAVLPGFRKQEAVVSGGGGGAGGGGQHPGPVAPEGASTRGAAPGEAAPAADPGPPAADPGPPAVPGP
ncbi:MAG TPA: MFS transporter [Acidimicrobiales bacterium]|nr:MFS transporter [Acidimicrobiales bacterium]